LQERQDRAAGRREPGRKKPPAEEDAPAPPVPPEKAPAQPSTEVDHEAQELLREAQQAAKATYQKLRSTLASLKHLMHCDRSTYSPTGLAGHANVLEREIKELMQALAVIDEKVPRVPRQPRCDIVWKEPDAAGRFVIRDPNNTGLVAVVTADAAITLALRAIDRKGDILAGLEEKKDISDAVLACAAGKLDEAAPWLDCDLSAALTKDLGEPVEVLSPAWLAEFILWYEDAARALRQLVQDRGRRRAPSADAEDAARKARKQEEKDWEDVREALNSPDMPKNSEFWPEEVQDALSGEDENLVK
jgi:hypothetical protein